MKEMTRRWLAVAFAVSLLAATASVGGAETSSTADTFVDFVDALSRSASGDR